LHEIGGWARGFTGARRMKKEKQIEKKKKLKKKN
jgi:hypothetical protein